MRGSGIKLKNEKVVAVQRGDVGVNDLTTYERSGIKVTTKWGGIRKTLREFFQKNEQKGTLQAKRAA